MIRNTFLESVRSVPMRLGSERIELSAAAIAFLLVLPLTAGAQPPGGAPPTARQAAPMELTGQWVAVVTEDWRYRMMTPPTGDVASVPVNAAGRAVANDWDPARDETEGNQCKAYGAAAIMRVPGRLRISWQNDTMLQIETDAGQQTRRLHFDGAPQERGEPSWQGTSTAEWIVFGRGGINPAGGGGFSGQRSGSLKVVTTGMRAGYLRKNGVPYSSDSVVTEYIDLLNQPDGSQWLVVKTIVEDPTYLNEPFVTSSNFKRETDQGGWDPQPCSAR